jgi:hypothetical protein
VVNNITWKINLVVGDYFSIQTAYVEHSKTACELITWLRSKTYVLAQLKDVQEKSGQRPRSVIRAVLTRWTAHYLAFSRLLELQHALKLLVNQDAMAQPNKRVLVSSSGSAASKKKAREMVTVMENSVFWHALARCEFTMFYIVAVSDLSLVQNKDPPGTPCKSRKCGTGCKLSVGSNSPHFRFALQAFRQTPSSRSCRCCGMHCNHRQH